MKNLLTSVRSLLVLTLLCGLIYPLIVTGAAQLLFPAQANGSLMTNDQAVVGSSLIAQGFEKDIYFWPRPSAVSFNPIPSGGSNLGPTSKALQTAMAERAARSKAANPGQGEPPQELILSSASGLDPDLSPAAIEYQVARVAKARSLSADDVRRQVFLATHGPQWGFMGETVVNVLALNLALDKLQSAVQTK